MGQDLGEARAARSDVLRLGNTDGGATQYLAVHKPTSNSVEFTQPDALYVGEKFVLEVLYSPALAIDAPLLEFVMPPHDAELRLELSRPVGNVDPARLADARHVELGRAVSAALYDCAFRVRHRTVGLVVPETDSDRWRIEAAFNQSTDRSGKIDARELRGSARAAGRARRPHDQERHVLRRYDVDGSKSLDMGEYTALVETVIAAQKKEAAGRGPRPRRRRRLPPVRLRP